MLAAPAGSASAATIGDSVTLTIPLDRPGSGTLAAFDPALGTLTSVRLTIRTDVEAQTCIENTSAEAGATVGGPVTANLTAQFPTGQNSTSADIATAVPTTNLPASNGNDTQCNAALDVPTDRFPSPVSASDLAFFEADDTASTDRTFTAAADMAPFVGPGRVPFSFTSVSNADITQPSEWDIIFVANGTLAITVTYTYEPTPCVPPTTTIAGQTPPTTAVGTTFCAPVPCVPPTTTIAGQTPPTTAVGTVFCTPVPCVPPTTTIPGQAPPTTAVGTVFCDPGALPVTGGSGTGVAVVAAVLTVLGAGALLLSRRRQLPAP